MSLRSVRPHRFFPLTMTLPMTTASTASAGSVSGTHPAAALAPQFAIHFDGEQQSNAVRDVIAVSEPHSLRTFTPSQAVLSHSVLNNVLGRSLECERGCPVLQRAADQSRSAAEGMFLALIWFTVAALSHSSLRPGSVAA